MRGGQGWGGVGVGGVSAAVTKRVSVSVQIPCLHCYPDPNKPTVYVDVKQHFNCYQSASPHSIVQELCESRGGRPGLSVLTSLLVSVDVKLY